jgi:hypothetical protein
MSQRFGKESAIHRRGFIGGLVAATMGGSLLEARGQAAGERPFRPGQHNDGSPQAPTGSLAAWIFVRSPLEFWMADYRRTFDAWEEGGVRGIAVGYLQFEDGKSGTKIPTFKADPAVYKRFGVSPPAEARRDPEKEKQLQAMLDNAALRGWEILFFGSGGRGGSRPAEEDPFGAVGFAAGVEDTMRAFPQASGVILDGAGEHRYELAFHHGGELFELSEPELQNFARLGFDAVRMERGMRHLRGQFHKLTPQRVRYLAGGGVLGGLALFDFNEDALYWLRTRQEKTLRNMAALREQIDQLSRKVKLATIPRSAAFSVLTTQDYEKTHSFFDYIFPKHYFWHRGFDGMYGTIARWVRRIGKWNPSLTERDCFTVVKSWFGLELPGIRSLSDMDLGFPDEFFSELVFSETRRALEATGNPDKVIAWVSTGRSPHAGDSMPAHDLHRILVASQRAGLKRFLFHASPDLTVPEWKVISRLCGKEWQEDPAGYWPSDTPKPDTFNGGRKPTEER